MLTFVGINPSVILKGDPKNPVYEPVSDLTNGYQKPTRALVANHHLDKRPKPPPNVARMVTRDGYCTTFCIKSSNNRSKIKDQLNDQLWVTAKHCLPKMPNGQSYGPYISFMGLPNTKYVGHMKDPQRDFAFLHARGPSIPDCNATLTFAAPQLLETWDLCGYGTVTPDNKSMTVGPGCIETRALEYTVIFVNSTQWALDTSPNTITAGYSGARPTDQNGDVRGVVTSKHPHLQIAYVAAPSLELMLKAAAEFPWANLNTNGNDTLDFFGIFDIIVIIGSVTLVCLLITCCSNPNTPEQERNEEVAANTQEIELEEGQKNADHVTSLPNTAAIEMATLDDEPVIIVL